VALVLLNFSDAVTSFSLAKLLVDRSRFKLLIGNGPQRSEGLEHGVVELQGYEGVVFIAE